MLRAITFWLARVQSECSPSSNHLQIFTYKNIFEEPGMALHTCSNSTWEEEAEGSQDQGHPGYIARLSKKQGI
jgi:hypothetical protein